MQESEITEFMKKLKGTPAPYACPADACGKTYKTAVGLQYHLKNHDKEPASLPSTPVTPTPKKKKKGLQTPKAEKTSPVQENQIQFDDSNSLVLKFNGKSIKIPVDEDLPVIDMQVYEKMTSHSNYEIESVEPPTEPEVKLPEAKFRIIEDYNIADSTARPNAYIRFIEKTAEELDGEIEYDMDEEDTTWLDMVNDQRKDSGVNPIPTDTLELLIDRLEKESYFQAASNGQAVSIVDEDAICCICMDGECQNTNVILFCDMCNLAVHQDCYGVPYIPEGQWLCRRCLQSPSKPVECKLCPNSGGAFKQTDTSEWAHVVCALWIPEVRFANTVFLEPIDSIDCIPPARWRLVCYICKQKTGACIQCNKNYCYSAFHVTCAQYAGLCMRMETVKSNDPNHPFLVQKIAFCDQHAPSNFGSEKSPVENEKAREECRNKMKMARKLLAKKRSSAPIILIPTIPNERVQEISNLVSMQKKSQFMQKLVAYWMLKRQFRNGVPLLRRLQTAQAGAQSKNGLEGSPDAKELYKQLKYWQHLRQDLERARLLCELVRKREKLKLLLIKTSEDLTLAQINPIANAMYKILDQLVAKDQLQIFLDPVDVTEVPDYATVIKNPIDLGTMREKLKEGQYETLEDLESDFTLMIKNCLLYNDKETIFYKAGVKMREAGGVIFRQARKELERNGTIDAPMSDAEISKIIDSGLKDIYEESPSHQALKKLEMLLVKASTVKHHLSRTKLIKTIKTEMTKMKKSMVSDDSDVDDAKSSISGFSAGDKISDMKTPSSSPLKASSLSTTSPGVNRRTAVLFTRKQQNVLKKPELQLKDDSMMDSLSASCKELEAKKPEEKKKRGRKPGKKSSDAINAHSSPKSPKKSFLPTPAILPNTNITLETPRFDSKIPDAFRLYRGQGSNSENSDGSDFSDSCTSCDDFSESYTNSEYGSSAEDDEDASDSDVNSENNNSDSGSLPPEKQQDEDTRTTSTSDKKDDERSEADEQDAHVLRPLQLVWAKSRGYPWYPALIIDPDIPHGFTHHSVPLPCPPQHVLDMRKKRNENEYLVLFFDAKRTWQWLPSTKLDKLGFQPKIDQSKLVESKKPADRKAVKKAYEEALHYQNQVTKKRPDGKLFHST